MPCVEGLLLGLSCHRMALCLAKLVSRTVEDLKLLPSLQANKVAYHSLGCHQETQTSHTETELMTHGTAGSVSLSTFSSIPLARRSPRSDENGPRWMPANAVNCVTGEEV